MMVEHGIAAVLKAACKEATKKLLQHFYHD